MKNEKTISNYETLMMVLDGHDFRKAYMLYVQDWVKTSRQMEEEQQLMSRSEEK